MSEKQTEKTAEGPEFRHIVRLMGVDIPGKKKTERALRGICGIGESLSSVLVSIAGSKGKKIGELSDSELSKLESVISNLKKQNVPDWMFNRRKDFETGENRHVLGVDLAYAKRADIEFMKKIRCRRGMRHAFGLKLRGQRTRSTGRHGKTVGVSKRALVASKKGAKK